MAFAHILGQDQAIRLLQKALSTQRLAHAYLFYGPSGVGKKLTAMTFIRALFCTSHYTDPCEACPTCHKITASNHPDVLLISPDGTSIRIDMIRTVQQRLGYKPYENRYTTILIDGAEFLTPPAANALLKTLEEPPEQALFILVTGKKDALPLTIISRCQQIAFRPLAAEHIRTILQHHGMDAATASLAATLAEGCLDRVALEDWPASLAARQTAYRLLQEGLQGKGVELFLQARQLASKRPQCESILHWVTLLCRDLVMLKVMPQGTLYNQDLYRELQTLAMPLQLDILLDAYELAERLRHYLTMNVNPQLIFEHFMVQLHPARQGS